ncbi:MAG: cobyric acid synthase [Chloroflexota bacterium]
MAAKTIMVQGTASSAGKSILVTALCRIFRQDGFRVAPYKAQNMALNSFVTIDGGELGRSQAVQAEAAGAEMTVDMNPILLKPEGEARCQVVVRGRPWKTLSATQYYDFKTELWPIALESLDRLRAQYEVVVIEGAGSPAEVNLHDNDIVNMRVALAAQAPVLLVSDIDRGGVFASLLGTLELLEPAERAAVKGLVINKFRGDLSLLQDGLDFIARRTGVPVVGVIPYLRDLRIADEDSVSLEHGWNGRQHAALDVAVLHLPRISNFDDFDPLKAEPTVSLRLVDEAKELGRPDLVIIPGTKATVADLEHLRRGGLAAAVVALAREGVPVIGICGGYQMLGSTLRDPEHAESAVDEAPGLGLLPVATTFAAEKSTWRVRGRVLGGPGLLSLAAGEEVEGYEIHMGQTEGAAQAVLRVEERSGQPAGGGHDGAVSADGLVFGTYWHGLFNRQGFRQRLLVWLARRKAVELDELSVAVDKEREYDRLAATVREGLDMRLIYDLVGLEGRW